MTFLLIKNFGRKEEEEEEGGGVGPGTGPGISSYRGREGPGDDVIFIKDGGGFGDYRRHFAPFRYREKPQRNE